MPCLSFALFFTVCEASKYNVNFAQPYRVVKFCDGVTDIQSRTKIWFAVPSAPSCFPRIWMGKHYRVASFGL